MYPYLRCLLDLIHCAGPLLISHERSPLIFRLRECDPLPDLVLLDLDMPRRSGREVLEELKAGRCPARAPGDHLQHLVLSAGRRALLPPPRELLPSVDFDGLGDVVRALDAFWIRQATLPGGAR